MCPERRPARGSATLPSKRPAARASITCSAFALRLAIICAWRAQGSVWASKAQARKSRRQVFSFSAATAGTATSRWRTIAAAMRSASVAGAAEGADGRTAVAASDI